MASSSRQPNAEDFEDIRPYNDGEIPDRVKQLINDDALIRSISQFMMPRLNSITPGIARRLIQKRLQKNFKSVHGIATLHDAISDYVIYLLDRTSAGFSCSGVDHIPVGQASIFISNHRDIALDSIMVNYALWLNNIATAQMAVGNNLLRPGFQSEFLRLNGSFSIVRDATGLRAQYRELERVSRYIRATLENGTSIWIAQRQGRAKDATDQTDAAIVKMFKLAYRGEIDSIADWLDQVNLVPVSLSYELDPCAPRKAKELVAISKHGDYQKSEQEDTESIITGVLGYKGRIHVHFSSPISGVFETESELASKLDEEIHNGIQLFPTYREASKLLQDEAHTLVLPESVRKEFTAQLAGLNEEEREITLQQYANQLHN